MFWALKAIVVFSTLLLMFSCGPSISDEMYHYGPNLRSDIVFYFKKDTTNEQINDFLDNQLSDPHPSGRGTWPKPGIQATIEVRTQDFEGYAITLRPDVTDEQRQNILSVLNNSPVIYKVFENVTPNEIVLDPKKAKQEKEEKEKEKAKNDNRPTKKAIVINSSENQ